MPENFDKKQEECKKFVQEQTFLREIIQVTASNLNLTEIFKMICEKTGKLFNSQRVTIVKFDKNDNLNWNLQHEYRQSEDIKGLKDVEFDIRTQAYIINCILKTGLFAIDNIDISDYPDYLKKNYIQIGVKSLLAVRIRKSEDIWGVLTISTNYEYRHWTKDDISILQSIADQAYLAIEQVEKILTEKKIAEREALLRKIIESIRSSLNINELKNKIVTEIGKTLNADRCAIIQYDRVNQRFLEVDKYSQYIAVGGLTSHVGFNIEEGDLRVLRDWFLNQKKELLIPDMDNPPADIDPKIIKMLKDFNIKSNYTVFITYGDQFLGILYLNYIKQKVMFSQDEINFFKFLASQSGIALYQSELYEKEKQRAEREALLSNIIKTIRSSLNLSETKTTIVNEIGKALNADRVFIIEFDPNTDKLEVLDKYSEYLSSPNLKSLVGFDFSSPKVEFLTDIIKQRKPIIFTDIETYIKENNLQNTELEKWLKYLETKSDISIPIFYGKKILGVLSIDYIKERVLFTDEQIKFIETVGDQVGIALNQARLYEKEKQTAQREYLLRKTTEILHSTFDIKKIKNIIVNEAGKALNADICYLLEYDKITKRIIKIDEESIYISSPEIKIITEYFPAAPLPQSQQIINKMIKDNEIIASNTEEFIKEYNLEGTEQAKLYKKWGVKSGIATPISYSGQIKAILLIMYIKKATVPTKDQLNLLKTFAAQAGIALYQSDLYITTKIQAEREALLRNIVEKIRSSLDIDETLTFICDEVARLFDVQRAILVEFSNPQNYEEYIVRREYKSSPEIKGIEALKFRKESVTYWGKITRGEDKNLIIDNISESDTPDYFKDSYKAIGVKSIVGFPIKKGEDKWGLLALFKYNGYRHWTENDKNLLEAITSQTYIAIKQAELYSTVKKQAEKEKLLRETISIIRSTLDIDKIIHTFVVELGKLLDAKRSFFSKYDRTKNIFLTPDENAEYLSSPDVKSYRNLGENFEKSYKFFSDYIRSTKKAISWENTEDFIKQYNLEGTSDAKTLKEYNIGASIIVPVLYKNTLFGAYAFICKEKQSFKQEDVNFIETVSNQTAAAIYQAELYEKEKEAVEREKLLRSIIESIRSTLDIGEIKKKVVGEVGQTFNADRCYFRSFDKTKNIFLAPDVEYVASPNIKSLINEEPDQLGLRYFFEEIKRREKGSYPIEVDEEFAKNKAIEKYFKSANIKVDYAVPIIDKQNQLTYLVLHYSKDIKLSEDDKMLLETIAHQVAIAFDQSILFNIIKETAQRESLLRNLIETIRSTLDINKTKMSIVNEVGKALNANRVLIIEFDPETNKPAILDKYSEYLSSPDEVSYVGYDFSSPNVSFFTDIHKQAKPVFIYDSEQYIKENNLQNTKVGKWLLESEIKSAIGIPLYYGKKVYGVMAINYTKEKVPLTDDLKEFVETIGDQVGIALNQARLFEREKEIAAREALLRKITEIIRSTFDIEKIKDSIVNLSGETLKTSRCFIVEFDKVNDKFLPVKNEYRSSSDIRSVINLTLDNEVPELANAIVTGKEIIIENSDEFIHEKNLQSTKTAEFLHNFQILSGFAIPIYYGNQFLGTLINHYDKKYAFTKEDIGFVRAFADQAGIAIHQAQLFDKEKQTAEREALLRGIIEKIRSSLDIDETLTFICDEVARLFDVERATILEFPNLPSYEEYIVRREYKSSPEIKGIEALKFRKEAAAYWGKTLLGENKNLIIDNISESDTPDYFKDNYKTIGVKSILGFPIKKGEDKWGLLAIFKYNGYRHWTENDKNLLEAITSQIYIAIKQAELYSTTKQTAEREALSRKIVEAIRGSLDINEIRENIVTEIGEFFNADRFFISEYDEKNDKFNIYYEYLSPNESLSVLGTESGKDLPEITKMVKGKNEVLAPDLEEFLQQNNLQDSLSAKTARMNKVKSFYLFSISYLDKFYGYFVLHYTKEKKFLSSEDLELLRGLAIQSGIAFHQSELYIKEKKTAERETTLRHIIEIVRSSLDINEIKNNIVKEVGKTFNTDRCFFRTYNKEKNFLLSPDIEYVSSQDIEPLRPFLYSKGANEYFLSVYGKGKDIIIPDVEVFLEEPNPEEMKNVLRADKIKSAYGFSVFSEKEFIGTFAVQYLKNKVILSTDDIELLKTVAKQSGIAIKQSELFNTIQQNAEKEKILREIVSELKPFQKVEDAFNYLLSKIASIYNAARTVIIEVPTQEYNRTRAGYEYKSNESLLSVKNARLPDICLEMFESIIGTYSYAVMPDTEKLHPDNKEVQNFFKKYSIKSFIGGPLVRYNHEAKLLGILFICNDKPRNWTEYEKSLLRAINESVVNVIWEILKNIEVNRLRDTFVTTLAHDLQVPIVGDINALEYLNSRPENLTIGSFKEIIEETIKNDKRILIILKNLLDSYQYESGKKELKRVETYFNKVINNVIDDKKSMAYSKGISIETHIPDNLSKIKIDEEEISKIIAILLDNSITYTNPGGHIIINVEQAKKNIITCITDNGQGIPQNMNELIFKRYEMAMQIERKIGAGISLYLAKQIVDAHDGKIWFTSTLGVGSTFCFSLPIQ